MNHHLYSLHLLTSALRTAGDAIESVALPWSVLQSTGSLLSIGGFALFTHLPWVILPPLLGRTLDKTRKRVRLAFSALLLQSALAVVIVPFSSNIWAFYLTVSGISALDILHRYYGFSLIATMTLEENELQGLNARLATVGNTVSLVAFPIAGVLAYRFGVKAMLLDAVLLLIGAFTLIPYLNVEVRRERNVEKAEEKRTKIEGNVVVGILASVLLFNFALGSFRIFLFAGIKELVKAEIIYGALESLQTTGSLLGVGIIVYFAHRGGFRTENTLIRRMLLQSLTLLLVGFSLIPALVSAVLLVGFGGQLLNVSFDSLMQKAIPSESLGTVRGVFDALATLVIPLSQLAFAWAIEESDEILALAIVAFSLALFASFVFWDTLRKAKA
ncbi:MFS transporter [Thermococcus sp.]|uniref:MFS transporter n=1 Tax=Thermococcus sp. TaxID=35749 RepID=UPI00260FCE9F|nr:MFS transporter [Thermococcus sp.]